MSNLENLKINFDLIRKYCENYKSNELNDELIKKCSELIVFVKFINEIANEYTFENLKFNGYFLFVKIVNLYFNQIVNQIRKNKIDPNLIKISSLLLTYRDFIQDIHDRLKKEQEDVNSNDIENEKSLVLKEVVINSKMFYTALFENEDVFPIIFSDYSTFYLRDEFRIPINYYFKWTALNYRLPYSLSSLWSSKKQGEYCVKQFKNCNLHHPFDFWHKTEGIWISKFGNYFVNKNIPVQSVTIQVPKQKRWKINYKGEILDFNNISKDEKENYLNDKEEQERQNSPGLRHRNWDTIKCRYSFITSKEKIRESIEKIRKDKENKEKIFKNLKYQSARRIRNKKDDDDKFNAENVIIVYMHGGGLVSQGSTSSELFLRNFVNNLGGIPILSIDYSLTVPFPIPVQEVLDVYLWLLSSGEDVKEFLNFTPTRIVLFGDSGGALFSISLSILINEINKMLSKQKKENLIQIPNSIVAVYPATSMVNMTISKCLLSIEPLLEIHLIALIFSKYASNLSTIGDFKKIENTEKFQEIAKRNKKLFDDGLLKDDFNFKTPKIVKDSDPWFQCDYKTYRNYADYISTFYSNSIISPCLYDKYDELKKIDLFVLSLENDIVLDDCVELVQKWSGNSSLWIFPNLIHGFLNFSFLSEEIVESMDLIIGILQEACHLI